MSIQVTLCLVAFSFRLIGGELVQDAAENHPIVVTEGERKASVARAASLKPDDLPALLDKAEKGDLESQILLGRAYLGAKGTSQDYSKAAKWLQKAADRGHPSAQTILGTMYMSGQGVGKDAGAAVSDELDRKSGWDKEFSPMAAEFKNKMIDKLSSIQKKLKPEEASTCQVRKNEWVKAHSSSFVVD